MIDRRVPRHEDVMPSCRSARGERVTHADRRQQSREPIGVGACAGAIEVERGAPVAAATCEVDREWMTCRDL